MFPKCIAILFFLVSACDVVQAQSNDTLIKVKNYSVGYNTDKRLHIILMKCVPGNSYFIVVSTTDRISSPINCKADALFEGITEEEFRNRVKKLIIDYNLLAKEPEDNIVLAENLFNRQPNFIVDLNENVYIDIKGKIKSPPIAAAASKPSKPLKDQKKKPVNDEGKEVEVKDQQDENDEAGEADSNVISHPNISFFNAANFSFDGKGTANYLGLLNIFAPNIKNCKWGFNAGIQKINYYNGDSNSIQYYQDNVLINPLDTIKIGTKYVRQFNKYTVTTSNTIWSFYIQPLYRITNIDDKDSKVGIYAHAHLELLIAKWKATTSIENIAKDTAVMSGTRGSIFSSLLPDKVVSNQTFLNGYFGVGLTFYLKPFRNDNSRFFFQPTIGLTTNYPNPSSVDIESNSTVDIIASTRPSRIRSYVASNAWNGFYLVKAKFIQALSSKTQIVVGTEMRGLFPRFAPQYAAFVGLNLDLNELSKLISDK